MAFIEIELTSVKLPWTHDSISYVFDFEGSREETERGASKACFRDFFFSYCPHCEWYNPA